MATEKTTPKASSPPASHDVEASASLDKDVAIALVGEHAHAIDPVIEARVLRKIDWFLIPAMIVGTPTHLHASMFQTRSPRTLILIRD
jgi:hypothetical protein